MTKQSLRRMVHFSILILFILCLGLQPLPIVAGGPMSIVVNSTGDQPDKSNDEVCETDTGNGVCTLRAAIMHANYKNSTGGTVIEFDISHENSYSPTTIDVPFALPSLGVPGITIQGPNLHDDSILVLDGNDGSYPGLEIKADNCSIRKLTIANFGGFGILAGTDIDTVTGTLIIGNTIGDMVPLNLFDDKSNGGGIKLVNNTLSTIGGETSADRNVIAGNSGPGIHIQGGSTNFVQGNYIGVKADGSTPLPNTSGVLVEASVNNSIGGNTVGKRNIISGNSADGIFLFADNNLVQGNYIGTDTGGTIAVPNGDNGVRVGDVTYAFSENQIGGSSSGEGNIISGNTTAGIHVQTSDYNIIQGNIIGLNATQSAALPNLFGITLKSSWNNFIGGSVAGAGNVIAGNEQQGILVHGNESGEACYDTSILGNFIGLNSSGQAFPNGLEGILLEDYSHGTNISGNNDADENTIAYNGGNGIAIEAAYAKVMGNKIYENEGLGIDVWTNTDQKGVTPNDPDESDHIQNFPIITDVSFPSENKVLLAVEVPTLENKDVRVNLFASDTCDPSGHGEGQVYLGHVMDISVGGLAEFTIAFDLTNSYMYYTATAWTVSNGQSEFSACKEAIYTLDVGIDGSGSVDKDPDETEFLFGEFVTLTPAANDGWSFSEWDGDAAGSDTPLSITILKDTTITAKFTQDEYTLSVSVSPEGKGIVVIDPVKETYQFGNEVTLTASAEDGWTFSGWNGDASGSDNPLTYTIEGNTSITAIFTQDEKAIFLPLILR